MGPDLQTVLQQNVTNSSGENLHMKFRNSTKTPNLMLSAKSKNEMTKPHSPAL